MLVSALHTNKKKSRLYGFSLSLLSLKFVKTTTLTLTVTLTVKKFKAHFLVFSQQETPKSPNKMKVAIYPL